MAECSFLLLIYSSKISPRSLNSCINLGLLSIPPVPPRSQRHSHVPLRGGHRVCVRVCGSPPFHEHQVGQKCPGVLHPAPVRSGTSAWMKGCFTCQTEQPGIPNTTSSMVILKVLTTRAFLCAADSLGGRLEGAVCFGHRAVGHSCRPHHSSCCFW